MIERKKPINDDVMGCAFNEICIRTCPHPQVIKKYGNFGVCHVSVYTCVKCKFVIRTPFCGAVGCGYESEANNEHDL